MSKLLKIKYHCAAGDEILPLKNSFKPHPLMKSILSQKNTKKKGKH